MAIIWNAARTTTVAALGTVAHTADAVSYLARTGSAYARDLHMTTELDLDQTRSDRMEATKHQRAIDHAHRHPKGQVTQASYTSPDVSIEVSETSRTVELVNLSEA